MRGPRLARLVACLVAGLLVQAPRAMGAAEPGLGRVVRPIPSLSVGVVPRRSVTTPSVTMDPPTFPCTDQRLYVTPCSASATGTYGNLNQAVIYLFNYDFVNAIEVYPTVTCPFPPATSFFDTCYPDRSNIAIGPGGMDSVIVYYQLIKPTHPMSPETIQLSFLNVPLGADPVIVTSSLRITAVWLPMEFEHHVDAYNPSACFANCFYARYAQSTVGYRSLDVARGVTLVYNGASVQPNPFVYVDLATTTGISSTGTLKFEATIDSTTATFSNGSTQLFFTGLSTSLPQARLGAQLDASTLPTRLHPLTVTVTDVTGLTGARTISTLIPVVNDQDSPIARGWGLAGLQRLYIRSGTTPSYLVVNGDGSYDVIGAIGSRDFSFLQSVGGNYIRVYPDGSKVTFNGSGYMTAFTDGATGLVTQYVYESYTGGQRLKQILDPYWTISGNPAATVFNYGTYGLSSIVEPGADGRTTTFTVDSTHNLTQWMDPDSATTTFTYDGSHRLETIQDRRGGTSVYYYHPTTGLLDSARGPQIPVDAGGGTTTLQYPVSQFSPWQTTGVPIGATSVGAPFTSTDAALAGGTADPLGNTTSATVDIWGQPTSVTDAVGRTTTYVRETRPQNNINPYGQVFVDTVITPFTRQITYPDGRQDEFAYDFSSARIHLVWQQQAGQGIEYYAYRNTGMSDSALLVDSVWGPGTRTQRFFYSTYAANGLPDSVLARTTLNEDPLVETEAVTRYTYDSTHRRRLTVTDAMGVVTTYTYDSTFGNQATVTAPGHGTSMRIFDSHGRDSLVYIPMHAPVRTTYDAMDRVIAASALTGTPVTTTSTYDALFSTGVIDAVGQRYVIERDAFGHVLRDCPANDSTTCRTLRYDRGGRLTSVTNRRGQSVQMTYDGVGRLLTRTATGIADSLAYDKTWYETRTTAWNNIARDSLFDTYIGSATSGTTDVTRFATDAAKYFRTLHSIIDVWTGEDSITVATNTGNTFSTVTYGKVPYVHDARSVKVGSGTDYPLLDQKQRLTQVMTGKTGGTPVYSLSGYTTGDRPSRLAFATPGLDSVFERAYAYDSLSRVQAVQQVRGHLQRQFSYDSLGRLSAVAYRNQPCQTWPGTPDADFGWRDTCVGTADSIQVFTYDAVGNRTDRSGTYTVGNHITHFGPWTFTYDADGNVTQKQDTLTGETWRYRWDPLNRLVGVVQAGGDSLTYEYDALGRLARRKTNGTIDRHWLYINSHIMAELDGSLQEQVRYSYKPGIDRPHKANGTRLIQDELGNVLGAWDYTPWGAPLDSVTSETKLLWKGLLYEADAGGLYYMRNRWYDPNIGRFISEDPIGLNGGINMYVFGANDPISNVDPSGLKTYVSCRPLLDERRLGHCGIRVYDTSRGLDVTIELTTPDGEYNDVFWWSARGDSVTEDAIRMFGGQWTQVGIPGGMNERSFDDAVLRAALRMTIIKRGKPYTRWGGGNSNRFVYDIITQAGGSVPGSVTDSFWAVPGLCGGWGPFTGGDCQ